MAVKNINAVNLRGKAKASQKKESKPTKEAIKRGMMGGFGAFSQGNDFGGTDWGNWGSDWGQQSAPPPNAGASPWGDGGGWQNDMNWEFGGGMGFQTDNWGQSPWGDSDISAQAHSGTSTIKTPLSKAPVEQSTPTGEQSEKEKPAKKPAPPTPPRPPRRP